MIGNILANALMYGSKTIAEKQSNTAFRIKFIKYGSEANYLKNTKIGVKVGKS